MSHSSWVRGLKLSKDNCIHGIPRRTLRECVDWNNRSPFFAKKVVVALFVSAWIEIILAVSHPLLDWSHSSWVRGLKSNDKRRGKTTESRTLRECVDWNTNRQKKLLKKKKSHSSWVRGLKFNSFFLMIVKRRRTLRECVDWNVSIFTKDDRFVVALFVSAWIEIKGLMQVIDPTFVALFVSAWIEMFCGFFKCPHRGYVALFVSAWIEILTNLMNKPAELCRTLRECVDWNTFMVTTTPIAEVALFVSAWIEMSAIIFFDKWHSVALFVSAWIEIIMVKQTEKW